MGKTISKVIDSGILTFEFRDSNDEIFSSFQINPTDVTLIGRSEEVSKKLHEMEKEYPEAGSLDDIVRYNKMIEEQLNYLLGYKASEGLFVPPITATTLLPSGKIFAFLVLDTILDILRPEIERRQKKAESEMNKYLKKYGEANGSV